MDPSIKKNEKCSICNGTGWTKRVREEHCSNCLKTGNRARVCYLCETKYAYLKGSYKICNQCDGAGNFFLS